MLYGQLKSVSSAFTAYLLVIHLLVCSRMKALIPPSSSSPAPRILPSLCSRNPTSTLSASNGPLHNKPPTQTQPRKCASYSSSKNTAVPVNKPSPTGTPNTSTVTMSSTDTQLPTAPRTTATDSASQQLNSSATIADAAVHLGRIIVSVAADTDQTISSEMVDTLVAATRNRYIQQR